MDVRSHNQGSERAHTGPPARAPRTPPGHATLEAYREHYARTVAFTDALREARCRHTDHFTPKHLADTLAAFRPLFAPWNVEIVFTLYLAGPARFNELKRALGNVSARVLTDKLRHLEAHAFVHREPSPQATTYALTPHGETAARHLHPLLFFLRNAGTRPGL